MNDDITLVTIYGDHNPEFIDDFVRSSFEQVLKVILVNYNNNQDVIKYEKRLMSDYPNLSVIQVKNNVSKFQIARANNIGLKQVKTKYVAFSGIDHVFPEGFFMEVSEMLKTGVIVLAWADLFDEDGIFMRCSSKSATGHLMCLETKQMMDINGFDEEFKTWGGEDNDLLDRVYSLGMKSRHVESAITHQWHSTAENKVGIDKIKEYEKVPNKPLVRNPNDWGIL